MNVETFEIEEDLTSEATAIVKDVEAIEIAQRMGLTGQLAEADTETLVRIPYAPMNKQERFVWKNHCPEQTELETFALGPIPLRVLQVAEYAAKNTPLNQLFVWHPKQIKEDPLLIAYKEGDSTWSGTPYLLARWGESLKPYTTLLAEAKTKFVTKYKAEVSKIRVLCTIADNDTSIKARFDKEDFDYPCSYHLD